MGDGSQANSTPSTKGPRPHDTLGPPALSLPLGTLALQLVSLFSLPWPRAGPSPSPDLASPWGSFFSISVSRATPQHCVPPHSPCPRCIRVTWGATYLPTPWFPREGADRQGPASLGKPGPRHRPEPLLFVVCAEQVCTVPTRVHKVTHGRETCTEPSTAVWRTHRDRETHRARRPAHAESRCGKMCAHSQRSNGNPRNPEAQTLPGCLPAPLPPAGRLPCQVQLSRPKQIPADKDTAFEPEPSPGL